MRVLPTEVKLIAGMLEEPADDSSELARRILLALEESRSKRKHYVVVVNDGGLVSTWGTYSTIKEATKQIGDPIIASKPGIKGILTLMHYSLDSVGAWDGN